MTTFFDLFVSDSATPQSGSAPTWADRQLLELLADSPLRLWHPGDPIVQQGERLLIGVATWSGYDMRLLDVIAEGLSRPGPAPLPVVEVFNIADCKEPGAFRHYIPKLHQVLHSPVVGIWRDGRLDEAVEGYEARDRAARMFGSDALAIGAYVREWIKARSAVQ